MSPVMRAIALRLLRYSPFWAPSPPAKEARCLPPRPCRLHLIRRLSCCNTPRLRRPSRCNTPQLRRPSRFNELRLPLQTYHSSAAPPPPAT